MARGKSDHPNTSKVRDFSLERSRILKNLCPKCGKDKLVTNWFSVMHTCECCQYVLQNQEGYTYGMSSIGYIIAFFLVVVPMCGLILMGLIPTFWGIIIMFLLSMGIYIALYPAMQIGAVWLNQILFRENEDSQEE